MNKTLIFLFAMYTSIGCSVTSLPKRQVGTGALVSIITLPRYSIIITTKDLQADRSLVMDVLMKGAIQVVEIKEWPLDGMRGELNVICRGDAKRIDEIRNELLLTGQVSKVSINKQY